MDLLIIAARRAATHLTAPRAIPGAVRLAGLSRIVLAGRIRILPVDHRAIRHAHRVQERTLRLGAATTTGGKGQQTEDQNGINHTYLLALIEPRCPALT